MKSTPPNFQPIVLFDHICENVTNENIVNAQSNEIYHAKFYSGRKIINISGPIEMSRDSINIYFNYVFTYYSNNRLSFMIMRNFKLDFFHVTLKSSRGICFRILKMKYFSFSMCLIFMKDKPSTMYIWDTVYMTKYHDLYVFKSQLNTCHGSVAKANASSGCFETAGLDSLIL